MFFRVFEHPKLLDFRISVFSQQNLNFITLLNQIHQVNYSLILSLIALLTFASEFNHKALAELNNNLNWQSESPKLQQHKDCDNHH